MGKIQLWLGKGLWKQQQKWLLGRPNLGLSSFIALIMQGLLQESQNTPVTLSSKGLNAKKRLQDFLPGIEEQD